MTHPNTGLSEHTCAGQKQHGTLLWHLLGCRVQGNYTKHFNTKFDTFIDGRLQIVLMFLRNCSMSIFIFKCLNLKTMRAEFIEETVIRPLTLLFGSLPKVCSRSIWQWGYRRRSWCIIDDEYNISPTPQIKDSKSEKWGDKFHGKIICLEWSNMP